MNIEKYVREHYNIFATKYFDNIVNSERHEYWVSRPELALGTKKRVDCGKSLINNYFTKKNAKILDVGCGFGRYTFFLSECGLKVSAFDLSYNCIAICKALNKKKRNDINFEVMDFTNMRYKNNCFDYLNCMDIIEHTLRKKELLSECKRVLKPNGLMILSYPNIEDELRHKNEKIVKIKNYLKLILINIKPKRLIDIEHPFPYPTNKEIEKLLEGENFEIISITKTPTVFVVCRKVEK